MSSPVNQSDTPASAASAEDSSPPVLDTSDATAPSTSQPTISTPIRFQTPEPDDDDDDDNEDDEEDDDDQDDSDDYSDDFSDQNAADDLSESEASSNGDILTAPNADEQDGDRPLITLQVDPATGLQVAMPALPARDNRARVSLLANRLRRQHRRMTSSVRPGGVTQRRTARFSDSGSAFTPADLPSPSSSSSSISKRPIPVMDEKTQSDLRKKIMEIQRDSSILPAKKALMIQELMAPPRTGSRKTTQQPSTDGSNSITEDDLETSYYDKELGVLGCQHYQRSCKLQANCCGGWFNCRFCHDDACDHEIVRSETKNMLCMRCKTVQPAAQSCSSCSTTLARYYCDICKLWDDQPDKSIYHCDDCGICRIGNGLGQDFFHCQKCNVCMHIDLKDNHKCIEGNLERDCPVCGEFLFTSKITVVFMPCGHSIHSTCREEHIKTSYQCPTCWKALGDMSRYYREIDALMAEQTMPQEYSNLISIVLCNDCEVRSEAPYHFMYHKCDKCKGYNTRVLEFKRITDGKHNVFQGAPAAIATSSSMITTVPGSNIVESSSSSSSSSMPSNPASSTDLLSLPPLPRDTNFDETTGSSGNSAP